jgi:hypothetical protein
VGGGVSSTVGNGVGTGVGSKVGAGVGLMTTGDCIPSISKSNVMIFPGSEKPLSRIPVLVMSPNEYESVFG